MALPDRALQVLDLMTQKGLGQRPLFFVCHSLGVLVARWYVQELGGHERVAQTISLGSPFGGTEIARRFPILVGRELHRTSPLLARLRARAHEHEVAHTSPM